MSVSALPTISDKVPNREPRSIGLWAKRYMSSPASEYEFMGEVVNAELLEHLAPRPPIDVGSLTDKKDERTTTVRKHWEKLARGEFRQQFSQARMADAQAWLDGEFDKVANTDNVIDPETCLLPQDLGEKLVRLGLREKVGGSRPVVRHPAEALENVPRPPDAEIAPLTTTARSDGLVPLTGPRVHTPSARGVTLEEFANARVWTGSYVATRPATGASALVAHSPALSHMAFWVFFVRAHHVPGTALPANTRGVGEADTDVYEAQLMAPTRSSEGMRAPMELLWEDLDKVIFLKTQRERDYPETEKAKRREALRAAKRGGVQIPAPKLVRKPVVVYLRPGNLIGGSFELSRQGRIPAVVHNYMREHLGLDY